MVLVELLKRTEGKTLEFKRDLSSPEGILKCLVAFANTAGGIVVIGVEDGSKNVRGVPDVLASEEKLANLVSDSIRPRLIPDIEADYDPAVSLPKIGCQDFGRTDCAVHHINADDDLEVCIPLAFRG